MTTTARTRHESEDLAIKSAFAEALRCIAFTVRSSIFGFGPRFTGEPVGCSGVFGEHYIRALGKPMWLFNRFDRFDTCRPWLLIDVLAHGRALRQFRQPKPRYWYCVVIDVRAALIRLAAGILKCGRRRFAEWLML